MMRANALKPARKKSLLGRLLLGFALVLGLIWLCALASVVWQANTDMVRHIELENRAYARKFLISTRAIKGTVPEIRAFMEENERLRIEFFGDIGLDMYVHMFVWKGGELAFGTPGVKAPAPPAFGAPAAQREGWVSHIEYDKASGLAVMRSQVVDSKWMFTPQGAGYLFTPLVYSLPFMLLPAWFIVSIGLRPLKQIVKAIEQRSPSELTPLPPSSYRELSPLIEAVNRLMKRLSERLAREQEFLTDAAHELKTPLSIIQLNAHLLNVSQEPQERKDANDGLALGVARATHTVHQLLALERTLAEASAAPLPLYDLKQLLSDRVAFAARVTGGRNIDIELHAPDSCVLPMHRESMAAMLDNLIGNAIKYSPNGGQVSVLLECAEDLAEVRISDQGPGIAPEMRTKVFERFYRVPGQDQDGSGLGLAIAERAAVRNKAKIVFTDTASGVGLMVVVSLTAPGMRASAPQVETVI